MTSPAAPNTVPDLEINSQDIINNEAESRTCYWRSPKPKPSAYWLNTSNLYFGLTPLTPTQPTSYLNEFTLLPLLPPELSLKIWTHFIHLTPRLVHLPSTPHPQTHQLQDRNPIPPILQISSSLRTLALTSLGYTYLQLPYLSPHRPNSIPILYHPQIDVLIFPSPENFSRDVWVEKLGRSKDLRSKGQAIALTYSEKWESTSWPSNQDPSEIFETTFAQFTETLHLPLWPSLKTVFIIIDTLELAGSATPGRELGFRWAMVGEIMDWEKLKFMNDPVTDWEDRFSGNKWKFGTTERRVEVMFVVETTREKRDGRTVGWVGGTPISWE